MNPTSKLFVAAICLIAAFVPAAARAEHCTDVSMVSRHTTHDTSGGELGLPTGPDLGAPCAAGAAGEGPDTQLVLPLSNQVKVRYNRALPVSSLTGWVQGLGADQPVVLHASELPGLAAFESDWINIDPTFFGAITASVTLPDGSVAEVEYATIG